MPKHIPVISPATQERQTEPGLMGAALVYILLVTMLLHCMCYAANGLSKKSVKSHNEQILNAPTSTQHWKTIFTKTYATGVSWLEDFHFTTPNSGWLLLSGYGKYPERLLRSKDGGNVWQDQKSPVGDISWVNQKVGWLNEHKFKHGIWRTLDGGKHWQESSAKRTPGLITAVSEQEAWGIDVEGNANYSLQRLVHTTDGGKSWQRVSLPPYPVLDLDMDEIVFADKLHGWVACSLPFDSEALPEHVTNDQLYILRTTDGGKTFKWITLPSYRRLFDFDLPIFSPDHMRCFGTQDVWLLREFNAQLLHSSDGGLTWQDATPQSERFTRIADVAVIDNQQVWILGSTDKGAKLIISKDAGQTWSAVPTGAENMGQALSKGIICVPDAKHIWIAGESDTPFMQTEGEKHIVFIMKYVP
jgi:photosystem II stability/assembly factor-like uncharacterized protein